MNQLNPILHSHNIFPLESILALLKKHKNCVFLETKRFDAQNRRSFLFLNPEKTITCYSLDKLEEKFKELEEILNQGYYAAGFINYEAGYAFEEMLKNKSSYSFPLLWFGVYKQPHIYNKRINLNRNQLKGNYTIKDIKPNILLNKYIQNIKRIKNFIADGETYQVNFTFKHKFSFKGSVNKLYSDLRDKQSVSYSALIKFGDYFILSFSPELFFRKKGNSIETRPMKGTFKKGRTLKEDLQNAESLKDSSKNRSENVMIVDLLRNDLGRISKTGSVKTKELFKVERYETLLQMISIIRSRLKNNLSLYEIFKNIFPSGSVTGAPKIRTMQIIKKIEREPRYVYTGGIGFISPRKESVFNVAIRTLIINKKENKGEMGIGSGIVYDSDPTSEYSECLLKSKFLTLEKNNFQLIETILFKSHRGYFLLNLHLKRLKSSSKYFNFCYNERYIKDKLIKLPKSFKKDKSYKVRLQLFKDGKIKITCSIIKSTKSTKPRIVKFANKRVLSDDVFLYHKTTKRRLFNEGYKKCRGKGLYDVIFKNENGEVTEGAISNIIIKKGRFYYTPPAKCGLLNGVYRQYLMKKRDLPLKEKILYKPDIIEADKVYLCNAIRGMQEVKVI